VIFLYQIVTYLLYLLVYPWARFQAARGNDLWRGRLGIGLPSKPVDLWMHAASVGEIRVLTNLMAYLFKARPQIRVHATAITRTGVETARSLLPRRVSVSFLPLDVAAVMDRAMEQLQPRMVVVAETEIWPNLIRAAANRRIPVVLVNGRMSESSRRKYRFIAGSLRGLLSSYDRFFFKSEADRDRYLSFGLSPDRALVTGDMKFDAPLALKSKEWVDEIRTEVGVTAEHFLLVAGSTRPGEEAILLDVLADLGSRYPQLRLVMAPRHLERLGEVEQLMVQSGLPHCLYGDGKVCGAVALVDRMGVLNDLYLAADLAFVGGTLVDIGGHNILEPVWAHTPVLFGPYLDNVAEAAEYITARKYGRLVKSPEELGQAIADVIEGRLELNVKEEEETGRSATAVAGKYILERLNHA